MLVLLHMYVKVKSVFLKENSVIEYSSWLYNRRQVSIQIYIHYSCVEIRRCAHQD